MPPKKNSTIAAIVITYFPDAEFPQRLRVLLDQFPEVIIVDNGSQGESLQMLLQLPESNTTLIRNAANEGIAAALNQGVTYATDKGHACVVTFDQDTLIQADFLVNLLHGWNELGNPIAIIGNNYLDNHRSRTRYSATTNQPCAEVTTVISSGMFFPLSLTNEIGGFLDELFIDGVDHEFCLRARKHGYKVWLLLKPAMRHEIGRPMATGNRLLRRFLPYNHPPFRKYYIARNTLHNIRVYWKQEPLWCIKRIGALILKLIAASLHAQRREHLKALLKGMADGVHNRPGKQDAPAA